MAKSTSELTVIQLSLRAIRRFNRSFGRKSRVLPFAFIGQGRPVLTSQLVVGDNGGTDAASLKQFDQWADDLGMSARARKVKAFGVLPDHLPGAEAKTRTSRRGTCLRVVRQYNIRTDRYVIRIDALVSA